MLNFITNATTYCKKHFSFAYNIQNNKTNVAVISESLAILIVWLHVNIRKIKNILINNILISK